MNSKMKFEDAMLMLEDTVSKLESGSLSLDDSLKAFEDAVKLVKICNEKLENARAHVRVLVKDAEGSVSDAPFDGEQDEA